MRWHLKLTNSQRSPGECRFLWAGAWPPQPHQKERRLSSSLPITASSKRLHSAVCVAGSAPSPVFGPSAIWSPPPVPDLANGDQAASGIRVLMPGSRVC